MSGQYQERIEYFKQYREKNKERLQHQRHDDYAHLRREREHPVRLELVRAHGLRLFRERGSAKAWTLSVSLTQTHTDMHTLIAHLTLPRSLWFSASHLSNITCSSSLADAPSSRPQDKKRKS